MTRDEQTRSDLERLRKLISNDPDSAETTAACRRALSAFDHQLRFLAAMHLGSAGARVIRELLDETTDEALWSDALLFLLRSFPEHLPDAPRRIASPRAIKHAAQRAIDAIQGRVALQEHGALSLVECRSEGAVSIASQAGEGALSVAAKIDPFK